MMGLSLLGGNEKMDLQDEDQQTQLFFDCDNQRKSLSKTLQSKDL